MCYEERLFRSWFAKKAQRREREVAASERGQPVESPVHSAPVSERTRVAAPHKPERRKMTELA
jgi:hypothetical protein